MNELIRLLIKVQPILEEWSVGCGYSVEEATKIRNDDRFAFIECMKVLMKTND